MTEFELFEALRPHYPAAEYALLPQVSNKTGGGATRTCDAIALSLWPSRGIFFSGFEIKSVRHDWVRELRNPQKAEEIASYCSAWWIVAGGPFITVEELPPLWGLMEWDPAKKILVKKKAAKQKEAVVPGIGFIAAMLRRAQEVVTPAAAITEAYGKGLKEGDRMAHVQATHDVRDYQLLKESVAAFEKASGVKIGRYEGESIGNAVKVVLSGSESRRRESLVHVARSILKELGEEETE